MLAAPATWAASVLDARYAGSSFDASAGPAGGFGPGGGARAGGFLPGGAGGYGGAGGFRPGGYGGAGGARPPAGPGGGAGGGILGSAATTLTSSEQQLYRYLSAHRDGASYLLAVQSWTAASPYILATGQEVMPMGGFSGSVPEPTLARVRQLVGAGQLRFFLLDGAGAVLGGGRTGSAAAPIAAWVESSCTAVPGQDYGATPSAAALGGSGTLYECGT